jgi:hypothetical protein
MDTYYKELKHVVDNFETYGDIIEPNLKKLKSKESDLINNFEILKETIDVSYSVMTDIAYSSFKKSKSFLDEYKSILDSVDITDESNEIITKKQSDDIYNLIDALGWSLYAMEDLNDKISELNKTINKAINGLMDIEAHIKEKSNMINGYAFDIDSAYADLKKSL